MPLIDPTLPRCFGNGKGQELYAHYHDTQWGVPVHLDQQLFEDLSLEGAQAGLSYWTILQKRTGYRAAFYQFDIERCACMTDGELEEQMHNPNIVRNKLKIFSVRKNAQAVLKIQKEFGSFDSYLWGFVDEKPIQRRPKKRSEMTKSDSISNLISKDLKRRGMSFVGPTIIYAYMQAVGLVNEHYADCHMA